ncbi:SusC/RagA family TonB-linked outer membrane protein [Wenyingzhuangia sp. IMCC45574]
MRFKLFENQKLRSVVFTLVAVFSFNLMYSQTKKVAGTVTSEAGEPLVGVTVTIKSTGKLTITDFDGNFEIAVKKGDVLEANYLGYGTKAITVKEQAKIIFKLEENADVLDEVVVVGYGQQKKKEVTGAVSNVKSEVLEQTTTSDIGAALQGQVAGVSVVAASGEPGSEASILIRGYSSLSEEQNNPLYVVDGIPFDNDPGLSVSEIESIDILKDAASAAIYGTRGAAGVILITTKKGKAGKMRVLFRGEYGVQNITSNTPLMNGREQFYTDLLLNVRRATDGRTIDNAFHNQSQNPENHFRDTNLERTILNDLAPIQNYNLSVSGGTKDLRYSFNANYFSQEGVIFNSDFNRFNIRSNVVYTSGKFKLTTGMSFRQDQRLRPDGNVFTQIFRYRPSRPDVDLNATVVPVGDDNDNQLRTTAGILRVITRENDNDKSLFSGNAQIDYEISKDFKITARAGGNITNEKVIQFRPNLSVITNEGRVIEPIAVDQRSSLTNTHYLSSKYTFEAIANYNKSFDKHTVNLTFANSIQQSNREGFQAERSLNGTNDIIRTLSGYTDFDYANIVANRPDFTTSLIGYLGRVQYNYDSKYLFSASIRRDGSSQFLENNRWGWFPSVSAGWNVSSEPFWGNLKSVVNNFKLRASYGTTGNDRFAAYQTNPVVSLGLNQGFGTSDYISFGAARVRHFNPDLKWETTVERNIGADVSFFKNQITFTADYYISDKSDLLFPVRVPPTAGVGTQSVNRTVVDNVGNMTNKGLELAVSFKDRKGPFKWNASLNYSRNENEVTKTSEDGAFVNLNNGNVGFGSRDNITVITKGYEAGAFFMLKNQGVIKTQEQLDAYNTDVVDADNNVIKRGVTSIGGVAPRLGDSMYEDVNGDGVIDDTDRTYVGSAIPDFQLGLNINASYKNFDLAMQLFGSFGGEIVNGSKAYAYHVGRHRDIFYAWSPVNTASDVPSYYGTNQGSVGTFSYRGISDYFLEDGSYVRLRNVALGYTLPKDVSKKIGMSKFRIYVQAQNALTFTKYTGFDPEVGNSGLNTRGLDKGTFPMSAQYKAGVQLQF